MNTHTFTICIHRDSPHLESYIKPLRKQMVSGIIILRTSTPSPYIRGMADKYGIPVSMRGGQSNIRADWDLTYHMANSKLVTIAHQDDMYHR